jgi:hypothetical protein
MKNSYILFVCYLLFSSFLLANIIHVPADTSTIQGGINLATHGDTVLVADSTYIENINFKGKAITLASHYLIDGDSTHIDSTIIDGSQNSHPDSGSVVYFISGEDTTSILYGFTITGGSGLTFTPGVLKIGGAIVAISGAKIVHNNIINNNITSSTIFTVGGGIAAGAPGETSWVVIKNNTIHYNSITNTAIGGGGGGGGVNVQANAIIKGNIVEHNTAESIHGYMAGGGIILGNDAAQPLIRYCIDNKIRYNRAISPNGVYVEGGSGGGLAVTTFPKAIIKYNDISFNEIQSNANSNTNCYGGGVFLHNQTEETIFAENIVANNKALINSICNGAGVCLWSLNINCNPKIIKNIIVNNTNGNYGGGLYIGGNLDNTPEIINNTICDNYAAEGGAVYSYLSHPYIENSILWNNGSSVHQSGGSVTATYSDVEGGWSGTGNINVDPLFEDTLYHLSPGSPCKDAGNPAPACKNSDGTRNDMGAYGGITDSLIYHLTGLFGLNDKSQLINKYKLSQNYPNPFNPLTNIEFQIQNIEFVQLKVYNILGQEVVTLVSEKLTPGIYKYTWNASDLASGIYLYKLKAGNFTETRKMILMQ